MIKFTTDSSIQTISLHCFSLKYNSCWRFVRSETGIRTLGRISFSFNWQDSVNGAELWASLQISYWTGTNLRSRNEVVEVPSITSAWSLAASRSELVHNSDFRLCKGGLYHVKLRVFLSILVFFGKRFKIVNTTFMDSNDVGPVAESDFHPQNQMSRESESR